MLLEEAFMGSVDMYRTFWKKAESCPALFFNKSKLPWRFELKQCLIIFALHVWVCECTKTQGGYVHLDSCLSSLLYLWFYLYYNVLSVHYCVWGSISGSWVGLCWISWQKNFIFLAPPSPQSHLLPSVLGVTGSIISVLLCWRKLVVSNERR